MAQVQRRVRRAAQAHVQPPKLSMPECLTWRTLLRLMIVYPGDVVLDAHCMDGLLLRKLMRARPNVKLCGSCFTPPQARMARQVVRQADIMFADEADFPWMSESVDVAFMARGFHTLENPVGTLHEIGRVLRGGGQVLVGALWAPQPLRTIINHVAFAGHARGRIRSRAEMMTLLKTAGFEQLCFLRSGLFGCVVTGLKK